jgi:hypothetical protein
MPASEKHHVVERIFDLLWDSRTNSLARTVVTMRDVQDAIAWANTNRGTSLSTGNPANFMKDVVRGLGGSRMWPDRLKHLGWTAQQRTGGNNVFEFIRYAPGQTEPFPDRFGYDPNLTPIHEVQSLSIPIATKELGRNDETYLIQVAVKLAVVETHFALESPHPIQHIEHLQVGVKLATSEVDSIYLATTRREDGSVDQVVITAEAKKRGQRILEDQIERQVHATFKAMRTIPKIIPIVMTSVLDGIYIAEFKHVNREELAMFTELELVGEGFYKLVPPIKGITVSITRKT